jgi:glycopeptide antibiotics resistance protein
MFVPLGALLPAVYTRLRSFFKTVFFSALLIAGVEAVQYVTLLGTCDIDDLILNLAGVILGYILYRCFRR